MSEILINKQLELQISNVLKCEFKELDINSTSKELKKEFEKLDAKSRDLYSSPKDMKIDDISQLINKLSFHQQELGTKSAKSRQFVDEITREIQILDTTKRNLKKSIIALKRIHLVVNSLDYLQGLLTRKQFKKISEILVVLDKIINELTSMKSVQQVKALLDRYTNYQLELRKVIFLEFEQSFNGNLIKHQAGLLNDSCLVLELLKTDAKNQLMRWYIEAQLQDYRNLFQKNPEVAGLSDITRRYSWLKRSLKSYDEQHADLFPLHWKLDSSLCVQFCQETKRDLIDVIIASERDGTFDTMLMLQAIHSTVEFESKLRKRFSPKLVDPDGSDMGSSTVLSPSIASATAAGTPVETEDLFKRAISSCFDPFLWHYVEMEDSTLSSKFEFYKKSLGTVDEGIFNLIKVYTLPLLNCFCLIGKR